MTLEGEEKRDGTGVEVEEVDVETTKPTTAETRHGGRGRRDDGAEEDLLEEIRIESTPILPGRRVATTAAGTGEKRVGTGTTLESLAPAPSQGWEAFSSWANFKAWSFQNYRAFSVTWLGEDISPLTILYIFLFLLSMNLLLFLAKVSLAWTLFLIFFFAVISLSFFFWSLLKRFRFFGAWMVLVPILMVMALCSASIYLEHYATLSNNRAADISVKEAPSYREFDVFTFSDGNVEWQRVGEYQRGQDDYFCVAPVIWQGWNSSRDEVTLWAGCGVTSPCTNSSASRLQSDPCLALWLQPIRQGLKVWQSEVEDFQSAASNAVSQYSLSSSPRAPIVYWQDPETILGKYQSVATDIVASSNAIWIFLTFIALSYLVHNYLLRGSRYMAI